MKKALPELAGVLAGQQPKNYIASFYDGRKRTVILVCVTDKNMLDKAFRSLKNKKYMDTATPVFQIE